jgi:hypothetical protein
MTADIYQMPKPLSALAQDIRFALARAEQGHIEWIEATLDLALKLKEARNHFTADREFSIWLIDNELDILGYQDRAALINMAGDLALARIVLSETKRTSWRHIWKEEMQLRFDHVVKPTGNDDAVSTALLASLPTVAEVTEKRPEADFSGRQPDLANELKVPGDQCRELFEPYNKRCRGALTRAFRDAKNNKNKTRLVVLFNIGLDVVRSGKAPQMGDKFDARIFMPDIPESISKWITIKDLLAKLDRIVLTNNKAAALRAAGASPAELYGEIEYFWKTGADQPKREVTVDPNDSKSKIGHKVKFCGETIWPNRALLNVHYDDLNAGFHLIDYWVNHLATAHPQRPKEIALQLRHLIQDIAKAKDLKALLEVMTVMLTAYSKTNDNREVANLDPKIPPGLAR